MSPIRERVVMYCLGAAVVVGSAASCVTARGLAQQGRLREACEAVSDAPWPMIDDDKPALASRVLHRTHGSVSAQHVGLELVGSPAGVSWAPSPIVLRVVVEGAGVRPGNVRAIDASGARVLAEPVDDRTLLALVQAPPEPQPIARSATTVGGTIAEVGKAIGVAVLGVPLSIVTLGLIKPDLGGALAPASPVRTWLEDNPARQEWLQRADVQAASALSRALHVDERGCPGTGVCTFAVAVPQATRAAALELAVDIDTGGCHLLQTVHVPIGREMRWSDFPVDEGQWGRFHASAWGLRPAFDGVTEEIADGIDGVGETCDGCTSCMNCGSW